MGIMDFIKKQFIDVIEWSESGDGVLVYQYPMQDKEIQNGAQLTVRESQLALFVNEGKIADLFGPGLHTLSTRTLPVLTNLKNWDKLFQSPFKSDLYYFSTREQIDQRWGTANPIILRDKEAGPIRLRAHGSYSYKITDPRLFFQKISGTRSLYRSEELDDQLRALIITSLSSHFGSASVSFLDMAAEQDRFSQTLKGVLQPAFAQYGLELATFLIQNISLPEDIQKYFDKASSMRMLGDLNRYAQFQASDSIPIAAANEGGIAGIGVGLGAGVGLGQAMAGALGGGAGGNNQAAAKEDSFALLEKMHDLLKKGVLTQEEFDRKKADILSRM
ncbi:MAG: SPFH domain-containing protein [Proteobacteria bacterium]|nr:MAG: SPFH domain-containing protein [Pseudomonadota bacterium]